MTAVSRRAVVAASGSAALAGCMTTAAEPRRDRLGLADIAIMRERLRDYPGTLRRVAALG